MKLLAMLKGPDGNESDKLAYIDLERTDIVEIIHPTQGLANKAFVVIKPAFIERLKDKFFLAADNALVVFNVWNSQCFQYNMMYHKQRIVGHATWDKINPPPSP